MFEDKNKKENQNKLNGQTPFGSRTIFIDGKAYNVNETKDSNGDTVYAGITKKFLGIF